MADRMLFDDAYKASAPGPSLDAMSLEDVRAHHAYFVDLLPDWLHQQPIAEKCRVRIELLAKEIELRRVLSQNEVQHQQNREIGKENNEIGRETRHWTKIGAWAAIAAAIFARIALGRDMPLSKLLHAIASKAFPPSSQQTTVPSSVAPRPTPQIQPSQALPATATATPTGTSIKFPPPAP